VQCRQRPTDRIIHRGQHGGVGAAPLVGDVREARQVLLGRVHRCVHGVEREVEEERPRPVSLDEADSAIGQLLGEIPHPFHRLPSVEDRVVARGHGVEVRMIAAEESIELVEATLHRMEWCGRSQMPFPE
jgi:hypothetical protein